MHWGALRYTKMHYESVRCSDHQWLGYPIQILNKHHKNCKSCHKLPGKSSLNGSFVLSCPVLSCPVLSCPNLFCPVLTCPVFWPYYTNDTYCNTSLKPNLQIYTMVLPITKILLPFYNPPIPNKRNYTQCVTNTPLPLYHTFLWIFYRP